MKINFPNNEEDILLIIVATFALVMILLLCAGCKTETICIAPVERPVIGYEYRHSSPNRFEGQFHQTDSAFVVKIREVTGKAAKKASE
jgi:hypothetical protein